ncbi:MAG: hypothetical protein ACR2PL_10180 [Dehalococcoidia bacterium]
MRFTFEVAQGKAAELQRLLEDFVKGRNSAGARAAVWVLVAGGPQSVCLVALFANLATVETARTRNLADPAMQAFARELAPLLARPAMTPELFQIIATSQ